MIEKEKANGWRRGERNLEDLDFTFFGWSVRYRYLIADLLHTSRLPLVQ